MSRNIYKSKSIMQIVGKTILSYFRKYYYANLLLTLIHIVIQIIRLDDIM